MYIFPDLKLIYMRVPKTGSTSFLNSMKDAGHEYVFRGKHEHEEHNTAAESKKFFTSDEWNSCLKIGFLRHPYDWAVSAWQSNIATVHTTAQAGEPSESLIEFVNNHNKTPIDWFDSESGFHVMLLEDLPIILEGYGGKPLHLNRNHVLQYKPYVLSGDEKEAIRIRFDREMGVYDATT